MPYFDEFRRQRRYHYEDATVHDCLEAKCTVNPLGEKILLPPPLEEYFEVLPQHKKMIGTHVWSLYKIQITEEEIDDLQRREPFVNFNYRQAEFLRKILILQKVCDPILWDTKLKIAEQTRNRFIYGFMRTHLAQAQACFIHGLSLATIFLCRSSLEVGLKEAVAHIRASKSENSFEREYSEIEKKTLYPSILEAQKIELITEKEINDIFTLPSKINLGFKPRQLLNKFIHGSYSELYVLVKEISIQGQGKGRDFEDFIEKMHELDKVMKMGRAFTRRTYATMVVNEQLALFFLQALFRIAKLIFYERLEKLL